ncbi:unnamed protein product [Ectocarpus sp. 13 AM-2016]
MTKNLLAPCESLRLCFRSDLPGKELKGELFGWGSKVDKAPHCTEAAQS